MALIKNPTEQKAIDSQWCLYNFILRIKWQNKILEKISIEINQQVLIFLNLSRTIHIKKIIHKNDQENLKYLLIKLKYIYFLLLKDHYKLNHIS